MQNFIIAVSLKTLIKVLIKQWVKKRITQQNTLLCSFKIHENLCNNDLMYIWFLTIVSTMFVLELRNVLAAKKTSTTLWWRIISRIMVQAQKVPLRPPPFLFQRDPRTHTHIQKDEDMNDLIRMCSRRVGGGYREKCHSLTERRSSMLSEKGQMADFQDEYLSKVLIKIQEQGINQIWGV